MCLSLIKTISNKDHLIYCSNCSNLFHSGIRLLGVRSQSDREGREASGAGEIIRVCRDSSRSVSTGFCHVARVQQIVTDAIIVLPAK